jgi:hypothetical protein
LEPTILASERAKTMHALDRSATVIEHLLTLRITVLNILAPLNFDPFIQEYTLGGAYPNIETALPML